MESMIRALRSGLRQMGSFLRWSLFALAIGFLVGGVAVLFHYGIETATQLRMRWPWVIFLLPLAGVAIVWMYRLCGMEQDRGTNLVLIAVREARPMRLRTAPLIFLSTVLTHLVGGSAGREGAALQLGGSMAAALGRAIRLDEKDRRIMVMCGMAAAFSALFGTPLTAAIFSMEVISVGVMYYAAIVPCLCSSLVALEVAELLGVPPAGYVITGIPPVTVQTLAQVALFGAACALLSILFCRAVHAAPGLYGRLTTHPSVRAALGGAILIGLTLLVGSQDYNGAGTAVIAQALAGQARPEAFLMKILFTGATFGCVAAPVVGLAPSFGGALGMAATFCGTTNCPVSSILLAFELFGGQGLRLFALCCAVSYMLSGYYGLYSEQKIVYSKFRPEWVDKKAE